MKKNLQITKEELLKIAIPLNGPNIYATDEYAELIVWMTRPSQNGLLKTCYCLTGRKKYQTILEVIAVSDDSIAMFEKKRKLHARVDMSATAKNLNKLIASL